MLPLDYLNKLRVAEIERTIGLFPRRGRILEIGAGTGQQARELNRRGFEVAAVELAASDYAANRVFPIIDYNGRQLPFPGASFDVVFSSNALEHVHGLSAIHAEIRRVLKPAGICIHILPTHNWRFWSMLTSFPGAVTDIVRAVRGTAPWRDAIRHTGAALLQPAHGERGHALTELWTFRPAWWRRHFVANGFVVVRDEPMGLFYTGDLLFRDHLSFPARARLARILGSACHLFVLRSRPAS